MLIAYDLTDELFGLAVAQPGYLDVHYYLGAMCAAMPCWSLGTVLGVLLGNLMPAWAESGFSVMLYGMFVAIVVPPAKKNRDVFVAVVLALIFSSLFSWTPGLKTVSPGLSIVVCTVAAAAICAVLFPVKEEREAA